MRIISAFLVLQIVLAVFFPEKAGAHEGLDASETKINLRIQDGGVYQSELSKEENSKFLAYSQGFKNILLTKEEIKREKTMAKYSRQVNPARLPKGKFVVNASAYTAAADECGKSDGITASGLMVKENETIACPREFPFGTKLQIEGMGTYVCQDRGGAIKGNHIDIYMKTKSQAFAFGRRNLLAEVVN